MAETYAFDEHREADLYGELLFFGHERVWVSLGEGTLHLHCRGEFYSNSDCPIGEISSNQHCNDEEYD